MKIGQLTYNSEETSYSNRQTFNADGVLIEGAQEPDRSGDRDFQ